MFKLKLAIVGLFLSLGMLHAQRVDVGLQIGGGFYHGDLSLPSYFSNAGQMNAAVGFTLRAQIIRGVNLRGGVISTRVESYDSRSNLDWRMERNLGFESSIFESSFMVELHPFRWMPVFDRTPISPYAFGGVGVFKFNPQASYNGEMVDLQPLGTEGQGMAGYASPYDLTSLVVPFGLGVRYEFGPWSIDLEYGIRMTNTDYLDDISTTYVGYDELRESNGLIAADLGNKIKAPTGKKRGNNTVKDWYAIPVLTLAYRFDFNNHYIRGGKRGRGMDCPKF